jgi:hypothetical protein
MIPATLARASTRPPAAATTAWVPSSVATSPATGTRSRSGNSAVSRSRRSAAMSAITTRAPSWARRSAVARPMPEPAPVTMAVRPVKRPGVNGGRGSVRAAASAGNSLLLDTVASSLTGDGS